MRAWIFQDTRQKQKLGEKDCPWSVGWYNPSGKKKSKRIGSKSQAEKYTRKIEGEIASGNYSVEAKGLWVDFRKAYDLRVLETKRRSKAHYTRALKTFERIAKPNRMQAITTGTIDDYIARRKAEKRSRGDKAKTIGPATINLELAIIQSALHKAKKWGFIASVPEFEFLRVGEKIPTYVSPEHFDAIYHATKEARLPEGLPCSAADWWKALLVFGYMTGWRIGSILALRWEDVDLERGVAISRADDNKGNRDAQVPLAPLVVEHLRKIRTFNKLVFAFPCCKKILYKQFWAIQAASGVKPTTKKQYGFHDLRRGFATMNAENLSGSVLQTLMQHRDSKTTARYVNMARQLNTSAAKLFVPTLTMSEPTAVAGA